MTGLDVLKEKLIEMGATKQQAESKTVFMVVQAMTEEPEILQLLSDIKQLREAKTDETLEALKLESTRKILDQEVKTKKEELNKLKQETSELKRIMGYKDCIRYIKDFKEDVQEMETPEMRDRMKAVQVMYNSFKDLEFPGERMAMVLSVGSLLSGEKLNRITKFMPTDIDRRIEDDANDCETF